MEIEKVIKAAIEEALSRDEVLNTLKLDYYKCDKCNSTIPKEDLIIEWPQKDYFRTLCPKCGNDINRYEQEDPTFWDDVNEKNIGM